MAIRFVSVVGADTTLLTYALAHYAGLGVEHFHVIRHVDTPDDPDLAESVAVMRAAGLEFAGVHAGPWHMDLNARLIREVMAQHPDDWWLVADLDEFHVFDRPVPAVVAHCERNGYDYVDGCFLDRVAEGGRLENPHGGLSLWQQYPLAGQLTYRLMDGRPTKVVLARGHVEIDIGQHMAWTGRPAPHDELYAQVHHFKWIASVRERLERRVREYASGTWEVLFPGVIDESRLLLAHLDEHGDRIDVANPRLAFFRCGAEYPDYPLWHQVPADVGSWYAFEADQRASRARDASSA